MSAWLLRGVRRYPGDSGERHDLRIDDGVISSWSDAGRGDATGATVIDLDGNWILPAFADSHLHLLYSIEHSRQHDLAGLSLEEIDGLLADASDGTDSISFVGHGWKDPLPAQMQPDPRRHLDGSIRDVPVFLWNADHHRALVSSAALQCAEIDPSGHSGIVVEEAAERVWTSLPRSARSDAAGAAGGSQKGITALQMDVKISGLSRELMARALEQAREGRLHILREMLKKLDRPRDEVSPLAPKIMRITIDPEKIGLVIGPGGKVIKGIQEETGATIEIVDSGVITIWGKGFDSANAAREQIEMITQDVEVGRIYDGKVVSIKDFGCFVEVLPGQEGLVHVSELSGDYVDDVSSVVKRGDALRVKVLESDPQGRLRLSHKAVLIEEGKLEATVPSDESGRGGRPDRGGRGGGDRDRRGGRGGDRGGRR